MIGTDLMNANACALKFVATTGVEMVAVGGVNAGANRIHISDGCGGTGAAKRVDQKHAGLPVVAKDAAQERLLAEVQTEGTMSAGAALAPSPLAAASKRLDAVRKLYKAPDPHEQPKQRHFKL